MRNRADAARPTAFHHYAAWYDAFNPDKNYAVEAEYVLGHVDALAGRPQRWLDIGCGTGRHLAWLHGRGIAVEGVDASAAMIARARSTHPDIAFHVGTAQDFDLARHRDVVSMLFHVINYQTSDDAVRAALRNISSHLDRSGVLVLDFWNSEAVLRDPPAVRVREARVDGRSLFRVSRPREDRGRRLVDVHYQFRWDHPEGDLAHEELHELRHFSGGELEGFLRDAGLRVLTCDGWMSGRPLCHEDWYGFICAGVAPPPGHR